MDGAQYSPGEQLRGTVYRVVRHLATGGMGSVYDVEDVTVGKRYVLKTLHPNLVSREDLARRMEVEARTLAKLQHPNIVDVVTAGVTRDERKMPFYVMERLNGQTVRFVLEKKGSLELAHAYRIAIDVLDALEHAHENGVIHRDVKPDNIFLHRNANGTTTTKLLDFGIVRLLDKKSSHTQGKFLGTVKYASPEQIMGGELGPPTDIYSLGLVLYEMLSGRGPFDDIGDGASIGAAHARDVPPPLSTFVRIPEPLEALVMSSLAKDPRGRPADCFAFARDLRQLLRELGEERSMETEAGMLSSVPDTRPSADPFGGTVASPRAPDTVAVGEDGATTTIAAPLAGAVDRGAETRASVLVTQRLDPPPPPPFAPPPREPDPIVFPPARSISGTGPMAGEAATRPPDAPRLLPLLGAALGGAAVVGVGVVVFALVRGGTPPAPAAVPPAAVLPTASSALESLPPVGAAPSATAPSAAPSASALPPPRASTPPRPTPLPVVKPGAAPTGRPSAAKPLQPPDIKF